MFHDPRTRNGKLTRALRICVVFVVLALSTATPSFAQQAEPSINLQPVSKAADSPARSLSRREIYDRALAAAVWIVTPVPDNGGIQFGTGWVVDAKRRLIVTNEHVIDISDDVKIYFPEHVDGRLQTEIEYYLKKARPVDGVVLDSDTPRDLALIQVDSLPAGTQELSIAKASARNTDQLHSVGAWPRGSGGLWVYSRGIVSNVVRRGIANGFDSLVVESDMPTNRGSSGSAVLNDAGEAVAVVEGGDERGSRVVSLFIDRSELQTFLDESLPLLDPKTAEQFVKRGERHLDERRYLLAIDDFNQALKLDPKLAKAYNGRGWGFHYENDNATALNDFAKAIELESTLADAHHGRGLVHRELGKHQEAIADFSNAIRNDPLNYDSYNERGITYFQLRDYNQAIADFTRAIERNADDAMLYFNRGQAQQLLGQYCTAIKDFQQAIQRDNRNSEFFNRLGVCHFELGEFTTARDAFVKALQIDKKDFYYTNLANSLQRLSQHGLAIEACNLALGLNQNFARAWQFRGISRRVLQQFQEALADFNRAIQLEPKVADHYFQRGLTLEAMKRAGEANRDFAKATELDAQRFPARQIQVSTAQAPKRDSQTPRIPQLAGTWKFRGRIDGVMTEIAVAFTAEGRYASIWREFDNSNRYTDYSDSGSYAVRNGKIHFETEQGTVRREFRFEGRWLWVNIAEHNVEVAFNRVQA